jgi:hypothetical protein
MVPFPIGLCVSDGLGTNRGLSTARRTIELIDRMGSLSASVQLCRQRKQVNLFEVTVSMHTCSQEPLISRPCLLGETGCMLLHPSS